MDPVIRLQGTDGIRGRIANVEPRAHGMNALIYFQETGFLTPAFFEHYTYAYASLLLEAGGIQKGEAIVIGWDPRDQEGDFNTAAVAGICKAGLKAIMVGVLPTPAIPLYMLSQKAAGSVVLTASHNPSDQNGIKLFHGWTALKFLPSDDAALTSKIIAQQNLDLENISVTKHSEDHIAAAKSFFIKYHDDPQNSWIDQQTFDDVVLVIDASKGAVATVVREIFGRYQFLDVIYTNLEGSINECCGVADLEGKELIQAGEITEEEGRFSSYETLQTMIGKARAIAGVQAGKTQIIGLVFDGDGDRCFRLDYHPYKDAVMVSSGDQLGIHLARYIKQRDGLKSGDAWFINTVESDLKTAITAEEEGYQSVITGVGDKWILKKAVLDLIQGQLNDNHSLSTSLKVFLQADVSGEDLSGLEISMAWKAYLQADVAKTEPPQYRYQIGIEESGHSILPGFINDGMASLRCFAGNGIKSGLNSLVAVQQTAPARNAENRISYLEHPFSAGIKTTLYTYYVNKNQLQPDSTFSQELEREVQKTVDEYFTSDYQASRIRFPEETSLIYFKILKDEKTAGAVFIRNSGTEDKSALYLRGETELAPVLEKIGRVLHLFLLKGMKNPKSDFVRFEIDALKMISEGQSLTPLTEKYPTLPYERILSEVEFKEGLIGREGKDLLLTEKGKLLNDYWERQD